jgi:hypothetical protein
VSVCEVFIRTSDMKKEGRKRNVENGSKEKRDE